LLLLAGLSLAAASWAATPTARELARARRWSAEHFRRARALSASRPVAEAPAGLVVLALGVRSTGPLLVRACDSLLVDFHSLLTWMR